MASVVHSAEIREQNRILLTKLLLVAVFMLGFAYALVPLYRQICEVLGINQTRVDIGASNTQVDASRWLTLELLATNTQGLQWQFAPTAKEITFHPGEQVEVRYRVTNTLGRDIVARAKPSVAPDYAASHMTKYACFCFDNQAFKAGETRELPVILKFDSALPKGVERLTLSYTFFEVDPSSWLATPGSKG